MRVINARNKIQGASKEIKYRIQDEKKMDSRVRENDREKNRNDRGEDWNDPNKARLHGASPA